MNNSIDTANRVIDIQAQALLGLKDHIDQNFTHACELIQSCTGKVVLMGMGKSGHIAAKIAATLASTGTSAFFVHPAEAGHGDLGMIDQSDVVIAISYSGKSDEILMLVPLIKRLGVPLITLTGNKKSALATTAQVHLDISVDQEACPHNLAPTSSTTATLVMGDALAISLLESKGFSADDFARTHPSGALGRHLLTFVADVMKKDNDLPIVVPDLPLVQALLVMTQKKLGLVIITQKSTVLGVFTDGDLRRVLQEHDNLQTLKIGDLMHQNCQTVLATKPAVFCVELMEKFKISALPVLDDKQQLVGVITTQCLFEAKII